MRSRLTALPAGIEPLAKVEAPPLLTIFIASEKDAMARRGTAPVCSKCAAPETQGGRGSWRRTLRVRRAPFVTPAAPRVPSPSPPHAPIPPLVSLPGGLSVYPSVCLPLCRPVRRPVGLCVCLCLTRQSEGAGVSFEGVLGFAGLPVHGRRRHEVPVPRAALPAGEGNDHF